MKAIRVNLARLRLYLARTSLLGIPAHRALLLELPLLVLRRLYGRVATSVYSFVNTWKLVDKPVRQQLRELTNTDPTVFYVIVMPGMLHLLIPAVRLIQNHTRIFFVLNGVPAEEINRLNDVFPQIPTIRLWTLPGYCWPHGHLLSILLRTSETDFGIIDHDFYLFKPAVFEKLRFEKNEFAITASTWKNRVTGQQFPLTHLLYLRVAPLRELMTRHGIDARMYKRLPRSLRPVLEAMGLSMNNPPKDYQSFFDSFQLLAAIALSEGLTIRRLDLQADDSVHIGGTSIGDPITKTAVHHYLCARLLESYPHPVTGSHYCPKGVAVNNLSTYQIRSVLEPHLITRADTLINRLDTHASD